MDLTSFEDKFPPPEGTSKAERRERLKLYEAGLKDFIAEGKSLEEYDYMFLTVVLPAMELSQQPERSSRGGLTPGGQMGFRTTLGEGQDSREVGPFALSKMRAWAAAGSKEAARLLKFKESVIGIKELLAAGKDVEAMRRFAEGMARASTIHAVEMPTVQLLYERARDVAAANLIPRDTRGGCTNADAMVAYVYSTMVQSANDPLLVRVLLGPLASTAAHTRDWRCYNLQGVIHAALGNSAESAAALQMALDTLPLAHLPPEEEALVVAEIQSDMGTQLMSVRIQDAVPALAAAAKVLDMQHPSMPRTLWHLAYIELAAHSVGADRGAYKGSFTRGKAWAAKAYECEAGLLPGYRGGVRCDVGRLAEGILKNEARLNVHACEGGNGCTNDGLHKCGGCGKAHYCSVECQRAAWKAGHKQECKGK